MSDLRSGPSDALERCLATWHRFLDGSEEAVLDDLLDEDCVFLSPIVFTPQKGKDMTKLYLTAAGNSLGGAEIPSGDAPSVAPPKVVSPVDPDGDWDGRFRYVRKVLQGNEAVLEFETTVAGKYVNGVDMITCNDDARVVSFEVMIRPLQAINIVHAQMKAMLEHLSS